MAESVLAMDDQVDKMNEAAYYSLSLLIKDQPALTPQSLNALVIARNLERVADHATNIAEESYSGCAVQMSATIRASRKTPHP